MATIADIRAAIVTAADTVTGIRASAYATDQVNPPTGGAHLMILRREATYNESFDGSYSIHFGGLALCSRDSERAAQVYLDSLCEPSGTGSLKYAIEENAALKALVDVVWVSTAGEQTVVSIAGQDYIGTEFDITITP